MSQEVKSEETPEQKEDRRHDHGRDLLKELFGGIGEDVMSVLVFIKHYVLTDLPAMVAQTMGDIFADGKSEIYRVLMQNLRPMLANDQDFLQSVCNNIKPDRQQHDEEPSKPVDAAEDELDAIGAKRVIKETEQKFQAALEKPASGDKPVETASADGAAKARTKLTIREMAKASKIASDRWQEATDKAYADLVQEFKDNAISFDHDAPADHLAGARHNMIAITYLMYEVARGNMTAAEAVVFAQQQPAWTRELDGFEQMLNGLHEQGYEVRRTARINGGNETIIPKDELRRAWENGEIKTLDDLIEVADAGGWLIELSGDRVTIGQAVREKREAEREQEKRDRATARNRKKR